MFELAWVGVPCVLVTIAYTALFSPRLLPDREGSRQRFEDARRYIVEMQFESDSPPAGQSIEAAVAGLVIR